MNVELVCVCLALGLLTLDDVLGQYLDHTFCVLDGSSCFLRGWV